MEAIKAKFYEKIQLSDFKSNNCLERNEYEATIDRMIEMENDHSIKKSQKDYKMLNRFEVTEIKIEGQRFQKLVKIGTELRFVCIEDVFDIIHSEHVKSGHNGRNRMVKSLNAVYANITQKQITIYLELCEKCQLKKPKIRKSLVVKPILSKRMNERCQCDLIDMQSERDGDYRFILNYQDHFTKLVSLRALKTKRAEEVADVLMDIFCERGAPTILHTDNGREFQNHVIKELVNLWPGCKMVSGKPRHSQSQGSVERSNREVQAKLACWKAENSCTKWTKGLRIVQWQMNSAYHSGIKHTPYEVTYGVKPAMGIARLTLPTEVEEAIETEEQLEQALGKPLNVEEEKEDEGGPSANEEEEVEAIGGTEFEEDEGILEDDRPKTAAEEIAERTEKIAEIREEAASGQKKQAEKMLANSSKRFPPAQIGDTVLVPIPEFDQGRAEFPNVMAVVLQEKDGFYKLGTVQGTLKQHYSRNEFTACREKFLAVENVPPKEISLREAANTAAIGHGQGMVKCGCKGDCQANSCKCFKNNMKCNSKCHSTNSKCKNKTE